MVRWKDGSGSVDRTSADVTAADSLRRPQAEVEADADQLAQAEAQEPRVVGRTDGHVEFERQPDDEEEPDGERGVEGRGPLVERQLDSPPDGRERGDGEQREAGREADGRPRRVEHERRRGAVGLDDPDRDSEDERDHVAQQIAPGELDAGGGRLISRGHSIGASAATSNKYPGGSGPATTPVSENVGVATEQLGRDLSADSLAGDVASLAHALGADDPVVVTDDKPLRKTCKALGVPVSGSMGVVIAAVERGDLDPNEAKDALVSMDEVGARLSARLLRKAERLIDEAAERREE